MGSLDYIIIGLYFAIMLGIGLAHCRVASTDVRSYFLGGNKIPWWITAMSSSMSSIDITGTMVNVSIFYFMGVRSFWYNIWVVAEIAMACHLGRWIRRSNVVTAAEWMSTRFGKGWAGELPRLTIAFVSIGLLIGYVAYAFVGVGKFVSAFVPALHPDPTTNAQILGIIVIAFTALYAMLGGLFSVAYTDLIQTFILLLTSLYITVVAFTKVDAAFIAAHTPAGWETWWPTAHIGYMADKAMAGYPAGAWETFWPWVMMWCFQTLLAFFSGPGYGQGMQFMLSTKCARDTCKQGALFNALAFPRWMLVVGITILALASTNINFNDTDMILPQIINEVIPMGFKGFVLVGFLAAFMSTFSVSINNGVSYIIRDLYTRHFRPEAGRREFIITTYISSILFVIVGVLLGTSMHSALELGVWVLQILGGSMLVSLVLRWYWWRFNGWGFSFGIMAAFLVAAAQKVIQGTYGYVWPDYAFYFLMTGVSLVVAVVVALLTPATEKETLIEFYRSVHPFGRWRTVENWVLERWPAHSREKMFGLDMFNCAVGGLNLFCLNLMVVFLMLHSWNWLALFVTVFLATAAIMYRTWYRTLPTD
ncbi:hypothetical protein LLH00_12480 [bacterium]|nr:hypothetical protein [bacterium]